MKALRISIAIGINCLLWTAYSSADEQLSNRALATCPSGGLMDATGKFCCPGSCGICGGNGCHQRNGGANSCCTSKIVTSCSSGMLPCVLSAKPPTTPPESSSCPAGSISDSTGKICCLSSCGQCGGNGCHLRPGGATACCTSKITKSCTGSKPPCKLTKTGTQPPTPNGCPAGGIKDVSGKFCCTGSCGTCGGSGCNKRKGGSGNCCTSQISASCATGKLPCVLGGKSPTPAPTTPKPTPTPSGLCKDGILSDDYDVYPPCIIIQGCCPKSCNVCFGDIHAICTEAPECCISEIVGEVFHNTLLSDIDVSCRSRGPPCIMPPADDPCAENPCKNGAPCGVALQSEYVYYEGYTCSEQVVCECDRVGNFYGKYCELKCKNGETPCGLYAEGGYTNVVERNDKCCMVDEECVVGFSGNSYMTNCFPKVRPSTCNPNPCKNGGTCKNVNDGDTRFDDKGPEVNLCFCTDGFGGIYCDVPL